MHYLEAHLECSGCTYKVYNPMTIKKLKKHGFVCPVCDDLLYVCK